ncbi:hypothetical protein OHA37_23315 [Streptomyces sp. NBC_00335]|uniref:hypothetical protein n=1 Tax=unclassified Streptomyces TaxID=2593676 RepID=UPI00225A5000|nr:MULTISPECIES: hypothetical protein [unclassified Streptomyces]MCX5406791.1 hypothetical protein [Streptomyces sp. NBC_00086]
MHGPGTPPPHGHQPSTGGVVALRVLFALLPILSCGFLAWGTMLRLALVTRKPRDWWLLAACGAAEVLSLALIGADPTPDASAWQGNAGAFGTLLNGLAVCIYYLVADIRHFEAQKAQPAAGWYPPPASPYVPPQQQTGPAYGYPPMAQTTPQHHPLQPQQPAPQQAPESAPAPTPPPRIGQVRAELDELSELLRKQQPPHNEGPRP